MPAALTRPWLKHAARIAGTLLCLVAIALLVRRGLVFGDALGERLSQISPRAFAAALGLYVVGGALLGLAWATLVRMASGAHPHVAPLFVGHLRAQLVKYLPGNVFHFAYRHLTARREGVGHRALVLVLALESILLISAAALLALGIVADPRLDSLARWARGLVWAAPVIALLAWIGLGIVGRRAGFAQLTARRTAGPLAIVLAIDLAFFVLAAAALRLLCADPDALPFAAWCGWLSLAWVLGYVTPGAPAGLGLREAALVLGLTPVLGEGGALALALAYRLLTLLADALFALVGFMMLRRSLARALMR